MNRRSGILIAIGFLIVIGVITGFVIMNKGGDSDSQTKLANSETGTQLWTCGMDPDVIAHEPGNCPKCGMKLVPVKNTGVGSSTMSGMNNDKSSKSKTQNEKERKILYWQAPMDPTEIYDHPGKSKMGMDLIPVYADQTGSGPAGTVTIDPATVQNMGVLYTTVKRMNFNRDVRAVGMVKYNEEKLYTVNTKISGWIEKLYVDYTGQEVKKGQPLLEIYSPDLVTTQEEYLLALNNKKAVSQSSFASIRDGAESLLNSTRQRLNYWDIPASEIERLESTGKVRKNLQLNAPASGVVTHKNAVEGLHVSAGMDLYKIADLSTVWVEASIYDYELPWVQKGQEAKADLSYLPEKSYQGKISYIYPYLDEKSRTVTIRLAFTNPDLELKPGMYANVYIKGKTIPDALVIPNEAIIRSGVRNVVFVARGEGRFEPREIKIGEEGGPNNQYVRVISGLLENEKIVTSAQFMLDSESRLQEAIQKMLADRQSQTRPMETPDKKIQKNMPEMKDGGKMQNMDHQQQENDQHDQDMQM
ncbi:MAG: efflux RND transporter periplasmic adaptor subunit [Calditrichia bacterium]